MIITVNKSQIYYDENYIFYVKEYYIYILNLLKIILNNKNININIILGDYDVNFINDNQTMKIGINYEHTLVKKGGRDSDGFPVGKIKYSDGEYYHVRVLNNNFLNNCDIVIDYSMPNIINIAESELFKKISENIVYISPFLYEYNLKNNDRKINLLTTFINCEEPRRKMLLEKMFENDLEVKNVNNCFENDKLYDLFSNTKILINIHQTEHHHTFEECRVLPALLSGVIVISEESPLKEKIPYNEYIIWSSYENLISTIKNVIINYNTYYNNIFNNEKINIILNNLKNNNYEMLSNKIIEKYVLRS